MGNVIFYLDVWRIWSCSEWELTFFWWYWASLARQMLYCLSPFSGYFVDRVLLFLCICFVLGFFCPGQPGPSSSYFTLPTFAGVTDGCHHSQLFFHWDGVSHFFLLRLAWNQDPPDLSFPHSNRCAPHLWHELTIPVEWRSIGGLAAVKSF
jgi:hypothetical protein